MSNRVYTITRRYNNGNILYHGYYEEDRLNRLDGPAEIHYHENGKKSCEIYFINDIIHRLDGPAVIYFNEFGLLIDSVSEYWVHGEQYFPASLDEFKKMVKLLMFK